MLINKFFILKIYIKNIKIFVKKNFELKIELYIPLIIAIIYALGSFITPIATNFNLEPYGGKLIYINETIRPLYIVEKILNTLLFFIDALLAFSSFMLLIFTFKSLNRLGSIQYPLKISYKDLRMGAFEKIGKFIISLNIPVILLSTFFSIVGLIHIFYIIDYIFGFTYILIGLTVTFSIAFLLYRNTIQINYAITEHKSKLKQDALDQIQNILDRPQKEINYDEICKIQEFYYADWHGNEKSVTCEINGLKFVWDEKLKNEIVDFFEIKPLLISNKCDIVVNGNNLNGGIDFSKYEFFLIYTGWTWTGSQCFSINYKPIITPPSDDQYDSYINLKILILEGGDDENHKKNMLRIDEIIKNNVLENLGLEKLFDIEKRL